MDLSSLEGPPILDDRFTLTISSPSPVSPLGGGPNWERAARARAPSIPQTIPQTPVSPLTDSGSVASFSSPGSLPSTLRRRPRGYSNSISNSGSSDYNHSQIGPHYHHHRPSNESQRRGSPRLRSSRSFSTLQVPASIPPRPASADNHQGSTTPRLITNGRLVWLDEQQIWVLLDSPLSQQQQQLQQHQQNQQNQQYQQWTGGRGGGLPRARNLDTIHVAQHSNNPLIQYYDPITHQDEIQILQDGGAVPPPSYESHRFFRGQLYPRRITIPDPARGHGYGYGNAHEAERPPRARTQWASVAERLGRSPLA